MKASSIARIWKIRKKMLEKSASCPELRAFSCASCLAIAGARRFVQYRAECRSDDDEGRASSAQASPTHPALLAARGERGKLASGAICVLAKSPAGLRTRPPCGGGQGW